jgi:hypothetical protein
VVVPVAEYGVELGPLVWFESSRPQHTMSTLVLPMAQVCSLPATMRLNLSGASTRAGALSGTSPGPPAAYPFTPVSP